MKNSHLWLLVRFASSIPVVVVVSFDAGTRLIVAVRAPLMVDCRTAAPAAVIPSHQSFSQMFNCSLSLMKQAPPTAYDGNLEWKYLNHLDNKSYLKLIHKYYAFLCKNLNQSQVEIWISIHGSVHSAMYICSNTEVFAFAKFFQI